MRIHCLSVQEPWASRIAYEGKTIENRTWPTSYRGLLLICASKFPKSPVSGKAVCMVNLIGCREMKPEDEKAAQSDYEPGTYSWILSGATPIEPFPVRGQLKIFEIELGENQIRRFQKVEA